MSSAVSLEVLLKRDRTVVAVGLVLITALAWTYLLYLASGMGGLGMSTDVAVPQMDAWGPVELLLTFIMWSVMMVAMMIPSAVPMILLFTKINETRREREDSALSTATFVSGYLLVWTALSALATLTQWGLHDLGLLSPMMKSSSSLLSGTLLIAAGVYQWTPLKRACLVHCRSPFHFIMTEWRSGAPGALRMGFRHGVYCVGCCWALMAVLFVAGIMNLLWVAAVAVFVLAEKLVPHGELIGRAAGIVLMIIGLGVLVL